MLNLLEKYIALKGDPQLYMKNVILKALLIHRVYCQMVLSLLLNSSLPNQSKETANSLMK
jgi:hypothetical protein